MKRLYPKLSRRKAVVILSGGIDSSTLLYWVVDHVPETYALTFDYGQRHTVETTAARKIVHHCRVLNALPKHKRIYHEMVDISNIKSLLKRSALIDSNIPVPDLPEEPKYYNTLGTTVVPNRNAILLSLAVGKAITEGAALVVYGAHKSDRGVYPDCRAEFVKAFEIQARLANDTPELKVAAPFINWNKSQIVRIGHILHVPFDSTWSCYKGGAKHCGACSSCHERKRAFAQAGITDPTVYVF